MDFMWTVLHERWIVHVVYLGGQINILPDPVAGHNPPLR